MRETWYLLEDGAVAHPNDVAPDANGKLYKGSIAVKMKGDIPHTTGVDVDAVAKEVESVPMDDREVTAEVPKRTYKTRGNR